MDRDQLKCCPTRYKITRLRRTGGTSQGITPPWNRCISVNKKNTINRKKQKLVVNITNTTNKRKKVKSKRRTNKARATRSPALAAMIQNPCTGPLVPAYGGTNGYISRIAGPYNLGNFAGSSAANLHGVVLWFPQYVTDASAGSANLPCNFMVFANASLGTSPTTTGAFFNGVNSTGSNTASSAFTAGTYAGIFDPAYSFCSSAIVEDSRVLAACLSLEYTGTTANSQGLVYPLANVPYDAVLNGGSATNGTPPNVSQIMRYAGDGRRADSKMDVKFTPDTVAMQFNDTYYGPFMCGANSAASGTGDSAITRTGQPMGFGFAFTNLAALNNYVLTATKVFEWRPKIVGGLASMVRNVSIPDPSFVQRALAYLDATMPEWRTNAVHAMSGSIGDLLRRVVLGGSDMGVMAPQSTLTSRRRIGL